MPPSPSNGFRLRPSVTAPTGRGEIRSLSSKRLRDGLEIGFPRTEHGKPRDQQITEGNAH